jgi:hypothetical protein
LALGTLVKLNPAAGEAATFAANGALSESAPPASSATTCLRRITCISFSSETGLSGNR